MSDFVERVAIAISGAPFATEKSRKKARAAMAIALEEAAKVAEGMYQQGQIGGDIAAAIRKLGEE